MGGGGVRMDVNEELKFNIVEMQKMGGGVRSGRGWGSMGVASNTYTFREIAFAMSKI